MSELVRPELHACIRRYLGLREADVAPNIDAIIQNHCRRQYTYLKQIVAAVKADLRG